MVEYDLDDVLWQRRDVQDLRREGKAAQPLQKRARPSRARWLERFTRAICVRRLGDGNGCLCRGVLDRFIHAG
jgi:hypothetical protein